MKMFLITAALALALVSCSSSVKAAPGGGELRFGVISDIHIGGSGHGTDVYPNEQRLEKALDWYNTQDGVKAVALVGDITDRATQEQWDTFKKSWDEHKGGLRLIAAMGNHDAYSEEQSAALFESATGQKANAHYVIEGYHFIVITGGEGAFTNLGAKGGAIAGGETVKTGSHGGSDVIPKSVKDWLRGRINDAKKAAPGQPVFVFVHWPVQNTFYVSDEWYTSNFGDDPLSGFFKDDHEVVVFSGHIHSPNNDPRSIWQGGFTSVNTATLYYFDMEKAGYQGAKYLGNGNPYNTPNPNPDSEGIVGSTYPKQAAESICGDAAAQGLLVTVNGSRVTIENYDFAVSRGPEGAVEKIPQTWIFDVSKSAEFPYTAAKREAQKTAPVFDAGAAASGPVYGKIRVKEQTETTVTVEFDQAVIPAPNPGGEAVHSYRFDFINKESGQIEVTRYQWSDFMVTPSLQKPVYEQRIGGLSAGAEYELRIYAYSSFQAESGQYLLSELSF